MRTVDVTGPSGLTSRQVQRLLRGDSNPQPHTHAILTAIALDHAANSQTTWNIVPARDRIARLTQYCDAREQYPAPSLPRVWQSASQQAGHLLLRRMQGGRSRETCAVARRRDERVNCPFALVLATITRVLEVAKQPMGIREVHAAVKELLGAQVSQSSV